MVFSSDESFSTRSLATALALSFLVSDSAPVLLVDVGQFSLPPFRASLIESLRDRKSVV
ncbi:hypothetical protein ANAPRD1_00272 [Anaplasma phagocytophilum]|nr:hypothetical protein ANAPRD1_00272 [Anaplasma phagocytophilum]